MRDIECRSDAACIMDILTGTTRALLLNGRPVIIELQRNANDLIAFTGKQTGDNGRVHSARHGDNHAGFGRGFGKPQGG